MSLCVIGNWFACLLDPEKITFNSIYLHTTASLAVPRMPMKILGLFSRLSESGTKSTNKLTNCRKCFRTNTSRMHLWVARLCGRPKWGIIIFGKISKKIYKYLCSWILKYVRQGKMLKPNQNNKQAGKRIYMEVEKRQHPASITSHRHPHFVEPKQNMGDIYTYEKPDMDWNERMNAHFRGKTFRSSHLFS